MEEEAGRKQHTGVNTRGLWEDGAHRRSWPSWAALANSSGSVLPLPWSPVVSWSSPCPPRGGVVRRAGRLGWVSLPSASHNKLRYRNPFSSPLIPGGVFVLQVNLSVSLCQTASLPPSLD